MRRPASMSLRFALLALLSARPMTGFDLMREFDSSVGYLWTAPHTQIYPELRKLEKVGLVAGEDKPRGARGTKREYQITAEGETELRSILSEVLQPRFERDPHRLRAAYMEWATRDAARAQLLAHLEFYVAAETLYKEEYELIVNEQIPLLKERLARTAPERRQGVVAFKAFAYTGMIERARAEAQWAEEGLRLLDSLPAEVFEPSDRPVAKR
jgi:PadR family transcriptional regulator, regulatory protein AphA